MCNLITHSLALYQCFNTWSTLIKLVLHDQKHLLGIKIYRSNIKVFKIKIKNPNMLETLENKILIPLGINFIKEFQSLCISYKPQHIKHFNYNIQIEWKQQIFIKRPTNIMDTMSYYKNNKTKLTKGNKQRYHPRKKTHKHISLLVKFSKVKHGI